MSTGSERCVRETAADFVVTLAVPTFTAPELIVEATPRTLFVKGARPGAAFERHYELGANIDPYRVSASLADGELEIRARKTASFRPHRVPVEDERLPGAHADTAPD